MTDAAALQGTKMDEPLKIGKYSFSSRLILGTGKYRSNEEMAKAHEISGTQMVTVAIRRIDLNDKSGKALLDFIDKKKCTLLPNTAGCYTSKDAILTAKLAREALKTDLIKLEVLGDEKTLFPDSAGLLEAAEALVKDGFTVLPYCSDDPILCKKLEQLGCPVVMPLGAPIGSGLGIRNPYNIKIILETVKVPVIVDAGVGTASDAAYAMELGCDAVLMNTAVACAKNTVQMAEAMKKAVESGRLAYLAGRIPMKLYATSSSPITDLIGS